MKNKDIHIRITESDLNYLKQLCKHYNCSQTILITELIRRGEYTQLNYEGLDEFMCMFGKIGNNINQIARALNIIKKEGYMTDNQYEEIIDNFKSIKEFYNLHQLESREMLKKNL